MPKFEAKYDPKKTPKAIRALAKEGLPKCEIASRLDPPVSPKTLNNWQTKYPAVKRALAPVLTRGKQETSRNPDGTFPKGQSGNPAGRAPGKLSLTKMLREKLAEIPASIGKGPDGKPVPNTQGLAFADAYITSLIRDAIAGDATARKMVMGYLEGTPKQRVELTGADGGPIQVEDLTEDDERRLIRETEQLAKDLAEYLDAGTGGGGAA
jgi:hypothetical protein